mmetsp:Transcript_17963/g.26917  ORF Transcript_17963/g.26917 Transcript_17963/m.26917 type:complete len:450 (+) Transcript_17963:179-1528(+)
MAPDRLHVPKPLKSNFTKKLLPRTHSWGLLQELKRLEQSPGVYHGAMLMLAINFHAQILADIQKNGLRFNYACLLHPILWYDFLVTATVVFGISIPIAITSHLITFAMAPRSSISRTPASRPLPSPPCPTPLKKLMSLIHAIFFLLQLALPHFALAVLDCNPISSAVASAASTCIALKTHSFFANVTMSLTSSHSGTYSLYWSFLQFLRFLFVPALVYQRGAMSVRSGRRSLYIRFERILSNWLQSLACLAWISVVFCQQIAPALMSAEGRLAGVHLFQICVPANLCWFLAFYCVFQNNFAILAELTQYPERRFYSDWWNATTVDQFWRRWNVPVHDFAVAHVFNPCIKTLKLSSKASGAVVFVLSALLHELTFAVAFKCYNCYFITLGMIIQIPLMHFSRGLEGKRSGNFFVWLNFVLGITFLANLYFQRWHQCCSRGDSAFQLFYRA